MSGQRSEDQAPGVLYVSDKDADLDLSLLTRHGAEEAVVEELVLVVSATRDAALAVGGRAQVVPNGWDGREGIEALADEWHREGVRLRERADTGERFVLFAEQTSRARSRREVLESLTEHAAAVAGGYRPVIWAQDRDETCFAARRDLAEPASVWISSSLPRLASPVLVTRADAESSEGFAGLAGLYETTGSIAGSLASLDEGLVLVVLERRSDRVWEPRHWFLLRATAGLARASLERLEALEEIEERGRR